MEYNCPYNCGGQVTRRQSFCPKCGGELDWPAGRSSGRIDHSPRDKRVPCGRCNRTGKVTEKTWTGQREITCPNCKGELSISIPYNWIKCGECRGRGGELVRGMIDPDHWVRCEPCRGLGWKEPSARYG